MHIGYRKRVIILLFILLLSRFWFSQTMELTRPEAYSWMKGRQLDWGYWDQGALVPWSSWLGTLLYRQTELGVRYMTANLYAVVGFIIFYVGRSWFNPRVAFYALLLYVALPIYAWQMLLLSEATFSVGFMALGLFVFRRLLLYDRWSDWLLSGLIVALATTLDWWNLLWALGLLLFHLVDHQRTKRFFNPQTIVFFLVSLAGVLPFFLYRWQVAGSAGFPINSWPMLHAHQYTGPVTGLWSFLHDQLIWSGLLGILAIVAFLMYRKIGTSFSRDLLFVCFLPIPGLCVQTLLGILGHPDEDVLAALWLPWLLLFGVMAARLLDQSIRWRAAFLAIYIFSCLQTLSGFWPSTADWWGRRYVSPPRHRIENVAAEVARWQNETGISFLVTTSPEEASLLSFYLPLQPFVYVAPIEGVHTQYDLWSSYYDFSGSSAIFLTRDSDDVPEEVKHTFSDVKKLHDITMTDQSPWHLYLCSHFNGSATAEK